jgi:hypothetical protein
MADRATADQVDAVVEWNQRHAIGTTVDVRRGDGSVTRTRTRSIAWLLGHGQPVVLLEGISGSYALEWVTPVIEVDTSSSDALPPVFDLGGEGG